MVHLFHRCGSLDLKDTVRQRSVGQRHAHGVTIQASTQLREDFGNGGGRTRTGWDQAHTGGTRTAQILVRLIENALCVGQVVDGGDRTVANAQLFVDDFHHWRQTVGGARSSGDDAMFRSIEQLMIDTHDDVQRAFSFTGAQTTTRLTP